MKPQHPSWEEQCRKSLIAVEEGLDDTLGRLERTHPEMVLVLRHMHNNIKDAARRIVKCQIKTMRTVSDSPSTRPTKT